MISTKSYRVFTSGSAIALAVGLASTAHAAGDPELKSGLDPYIVVTDGIELNDPPPEGAYDSIVDVTGVGQMVTQPDPNSFSVGLCTGTLINPRTVIFAAHCVNDIPAEDYGAASGGTPMSFGFSAYNLPAVREWIGLGESAPYQTHPELNIYNVEQVWYDTRSLPTTFLEADVALATLDTHADNVPTWTMLFSPLTEETHAIVNGYGSRGVGSEGDIGIDWRRRVAENMISVLGSLDDVDEWLYGPGEYGLPQTLYQLDFDNPGGRDDPDYGIEGAGYDFDVLDGDALPLEGITAGGDSGGPLIADEAFDKPVVVGVLSGGSRYFSEQLFSTYGTTSFYQPLFMFWESIVANNSYVYASANPGISNWNRPSHWVQTMDPNYAISVGGELVNALPGFEEPGVTDQTPKFGVVCDTDDDCHDISGEGVRLRGQPNSVFVPGGPGSDRFVPNNVVADPDAGVKARYYEVTLSANGQTVLSDSKTIDRLNLGGLAMLRVRNNGDLTVWGDYTQTGGTLELNGSLSTGEAFMQFGLLQGSGVFDPTYFTNFAGYIAPGELTRAGRLTIQGDVILSSASVTVFNLERTRSDVLAVEGDDDNEGIISLGGLAAFLPGEFSGPRFGEEYTIVTAEGGVQETFDTAFWAGVGVLFPELDYDSNQVTVAIKAGSFADYLAKNGVSDPYALAFGGAFDDLRTNNYADLANVFGAIDMMGAADLASTFRGNSAAVAGDLAVSDERQNAYVRQLVSDRLSIMGQAGTGGTMRQLGMAGELATGRNVDRSADSQRSFAQSYQPRAVAGLKLPEQVSGFVSSGYRRMNDTAAGTGSRNESGTWHMAMGLEVALDERNALGSAFGYSRGQRQVQGSLAEIASSNAAIYASHRLGGGAYVGGQVSLAYSALDADQAPTFGNSRFALDSHALSYAGEVELGYNHSMGGLTLTPRSRLEYESYAVDGFQDRQANFAMAVDGIERRGLDWRNGLKLTGSTSLGYASEWSFQPELQVDYVRRLSGNDTSIDLRFLEASQLGINVPIRLHDASYGEVRGGLKLTNGRFSLGAALETQMGQDLYRDDRGVINVAFAF